MSERTSAEVYTVCEPAGDQCGFLLLEPLELLPLALDEESE
ncbi:hypothetical protein [Pectobacterium versatile]